jgi:hypothetical protein
MGDFTERMLQIKEQVGRGHLVAHCVVDQAYAQNQHQTVTFNHDDGRPFYLGAPMMESYLEWFMQIARKAITEDGSDIESAMIDIAEAMSQAVFDNAPRVIEELATSGHPFVERDGVIIYDRPPISDRRPPGFKHL